MMDTTLLIAQWREAKAKEDRARLTRREIEAKLVEKVPSDKEEGTEHIVAGGYKVTVTRKLNRRLLPDAWEQVRHLVPEGLEPVRTKMELDLKKYRAIEQANPALFATVSRAIMVKPAATSIKIEEVK